MTNKTKELLINSLEQFNKSSRTDKIKLLGFVYNQLIRAQNANKIGFPLDKDSINAGEIFIRIAESKLYKTK